MSLNSVHPYTFSGVSPRKSSELVCIQTRSHIGIQCSKFLLQSDCIATLAYLFFQSIEYWRGMVNDWKTPAQHVPSAATPDKF
ncbi:hypothetical protein TNCV_664701 [Trichonephila clavipes]|nr:hypothetical protein TNCV_664701 [Trichonephila clavipes]